MKEIELDGASTIASFFRGNKGVSYAEVARDVASKLGVEISQYEEEASMEIKCLEKMIEKYLANASPEEREKIKEFLESAKKGAIQNAGEVLKRVGQGAGNAGLLVALIAQVGRKAMTDIVKKILLSIMAKRVAKEAGKRAAALVGFGVPVLNVVMAGWTLIDLAGPAYRKTVPTVLEIALLRLEYGAQEDTQ